jgi:tellurite resistance protein TerC
MVLVFVGIKMLLAGTRFEISTYLSLGVIFAVLTISILASIVRGNRHPENREKENKGQPES